MTPPDPKASRPNTRAAPASRNLPYSVDQVLARRRAEGGRWFSRRLIWTSIVLHVAVAAILLLGPVLFADRHETFEYIEVVAVPPEALTRPRPKPPPKQEEPPPPAPEPEPEPEPPPKPEVVLPREEPKPEPPPPKPEPEPAPEPEPVDPEPVERPGEDDAVPEPEPFVEAGPNQAMLFDNPDFTFGYYVNQMSSAVRRNWSRPPASDDTILIVHFVILRDGTVTELELVESSGNGAFDRAGMRAVSAASPLPPLPRGYREETLGVTLRFS